MDIWKVMRERHSVRRYKDHPIEKDKVAVLQGTVEQFNREAGLHIQLLTEEPEAFSPNLFHYGAIKGCRNYIAMAAPKAAEEAVGYWGEKLVLLAQDLGLYTCWVALSYRKGKAKVSLEPGEKLHVIIALGYGENEGVPHRSKSMDKLAELRPDSPEWFRLGVEAASLAPTAINQQQFYVAMPAEGIVSAKAGPGPCSHIDLGIVKCHFELAAGKENFDWLQL